MKQNSYQNLCHSIINAYVLILFGEVMLPYIKFMTCFSDCYDCRCFKEHDGEISIHCIDVSTVDLLGDNSCLDVA